LPPGTTCRSRCWLDLRAGEQNKVPGEAINPHPVVPTLGGGDLRSTASSAILEGRPMWAP
jgi:hypothetical protein